MKFFFLDVVRWIEKYISGRDPRIDVGGELSVTNPMRNVVPPRCVICLLLFLLFVNDLPDVLETLTLLGNSPGIGHEPSHFSYCSMGLVKKWTYRSILVSETTSKLGE